MRTVVSNITVEGYILQSHQVYIDNRQYGTEKCNL